MKSSLDIFGLDISGLEEYFSFADEKYYLIANNRNINPKFFDSLVEQRDARVIQFNKAIHDKSIASGRKSFFYNGCHLGGLWGFSQHEIQLPKSSYLGCLHFCFGVDVVPFVKKNSGLNLISIAKKSDLLKIFSYPDGKTPSIGFLVIMLLSFELIRRGIPPAERLILVGFTGGTVLSQHHATEWEQNFIKNFGFKNVGLDGYVVRGDVVPPNDSDAPTDKGGELIRYYEVMHSEGYHRSDGKFIPPEQAFASFELLRFVDFIDKSIFNNANVLDYGGGKANWYSSKINGVLLSDVLSFKSVSKYEPALKDKIIADDKFDVVVLMDVLEHVYVSHIYDLLSHALALSSGYFVCNVAIYKAMALLPNGENAHISVRPAEWWLGIFEVLSHKFPLIEMTLFISRSYNSAEKYVLKGSAVQEIPSFETVLPRSLRKVVV